MIHYVYPTHFSIHEPTLVKCHFHNHCVFHILPHVLRFAFFDSSEPIVVTIDLVLTRTPLALQQKQALFDAKLMRATGQSVQLPSLKLTASLHLKNGWLEYDPFSFPIGKVVTFQGRTAVSFREGMSL